MLFLDSTQCCGERGPVAGLPDEFTCNSLHSEKKGYTEDWPHQSHFSHRGEEGPQTAFVSLSVLCQMRSATRQ